MSIQITALLIFVGFLLFFFLIILLVLKLKRRREFFSLQEIKKGDSARVLKNYDIAPLVIDIDNQTKLYCYSYRYWVGFIFGGTKTKNIVFTITENKICFISSNI